MQIKNRLEYLLRVKIFSVLFILFFHTPSTWCCNRTLLNSEAEAMSTKIWQGSEITEEQVRESLKFVHDEKEARKYEDKKFPETLKQIKKLIKNKNFILFSKICQEIYDSDKDNQVAISIFYSEVINKYKSYYILQQEIEKNWKISIQHKKYDNPGKNKARKTLPVTEVSTPNTCCDFYTYNVKDNTNSIIEALKNSSELCSLGLAKNNIDSMLFKSLTRELNLKAFSELKLVDISENPIDKSAALALGEWLSISSQPYIILTATTLKCKNISALYDEFRKSFSKGLVEEFMKRIIFVSFDYLGHIKNNVPQVYQSLVGEGKIAENWIEIHENFYKEKFYKNLLEERNKNQLLKEQILHL